MGTPSQTELYCAASGNGKFIVCGFGPEPFRVNGLLGESNAAIHEAAGRGQPVTASYDKTALIGSGKLTSTNGYYGLRFAHNTDVFVQSFGHVNQVNAAGK